MNSFVALLVLLSFIAPSLTLQTIYVSTTPGSNPDGSESNPYGSFADAVNASGSEAKISAFPGTYSGKDNYNIVIKTQNLAFTVNGNPSKDPVIIDFGGEKHFFLNFETAGVPFYISGYTFQNQSSESKDYILSFSDTLTTAVTYCHFNNVGLAVKMNNVANARVNSCTFENILSQNNYAFNITNSGGYISFCRFENAKEGAITIEYTDTVVANNFTLASVEFYYISGYNLLVNAVSDTTVIVNGCLFNPVSRDIAVLSYTDGLLLFQEVCKKFPVVSSSKGTVGVCGCEHIRGITTTALYLSGGNFNSHGDILVDEFQWTGGNISGDSKLDAGVCKNNNNNNNNNNIMSVDTDYFATITVQNKAELYGDLKSRNVDWVVPVDSIVYVGNTANPDITTTHLDIGDRDITIMRGSEQTRGQLFIFSSYFGDHSVLITCKNVYNLGYLQMQLNSVINATVYQHEHLAVNYDSLTTAPNYIPTITNQVVLKGSVLEYVFTGEESIKNETLYVLEYTTNKGQFDDFELTPTYGNPDLPTTLEYQENAIICIVGN